LSNCDLQRHPKSCVITQLNYPRTECRDCATGKKNDGIVAAKMAEESQRPIPRETIQQKKEEVGKVGDLKAAEARVLTRILREKACSRSRLTQFSHVSGAELDAVAKELEKEGKIKTWPKGRSCFYTPPDAPDPWGGAKKKAAPSNDATKASEKPSHVNRKPTPRKPRAKPLSTTGKKVVDDNLPADGAYAEIIKDLKAKRQNIDNVITALEALG
jgi:DNA-binding MarR family transcriptional regulator